MRHNYNSPPFVEFVKVFDDGSLIFGIKGVSRFIEEDEVRILIYSPCNQDALLLSLAKPYAITPDDSVVFQWKTHNVVMDIGYPGGFFETFHVYIAIIHSDIPGDGF